MKEKETIFKVNDKEYKAVFNLNVVQNLQEEYGTFERWVQLTDNYKYDDNGEQIAKLDKNGKPILEKIQQDGAEIEVEVYEEKEPDIRALIFGIKEMINEAIDIENESRETKLEFLNEKQVGRLITKIGIFDASEKITNLVIDSTDSDNSKNE